MVVYDDEDDAENEANSPVLEQFNPNLSPESDTFSAPSPPRHRPTFDPGDAALIQNIGPNNPELARFGCDPFDASSEGSFDHGSPMTEHIEVEQDSGSRNDEQEAKLSGEIDSVLRSERVATESRENFDEKSLEAQAAAAVEVSREHAINKRVDSAQNQVPQLEPDQRSARSSPSLKLQTVQDDTIARSPTLRKHALPVTKGTPGTLPEFHPTSPTSKDGSASSPQNERLPSIRQVTGRIPEVTGRIPELAEAATQLDPRVQQHSHHHSQSFGSATSQSPMIPYHPAYPGNVQASPSSQYAYSARSPTSTIGDHHYGSPIQYPGPAYYAGRRSSAAAESNVPLLASLPSASSSGESYGPASSSADGYSTNHTTPIDGPIPVDGTSRPMPILPPPRGMPESAVMIPGGFRCDEPNCNAVPFQTQYLLSSHKNVHSQNRPHYCPVEDCPRSEGGRGFKRKNEMIRHGLVHNSPGYICPFCPDREHRYPRPDNLQRHVRVHHVDKDRDDPNLRDVLAQRNEGTGKTRRRRANTAGSATS